MEAFIFGPPAAALLFLLIAALLSRSARRHPAGMRYAACVMTLLLFAAAAFLALAATHPIHMKDFFGNGIPMWFLFTGVMPCFAVQDRFLAPHARLPRLFYACAAVVFLICGLRYFAWWPPDADGAWIEAMNDGYVRYLPVSLRSYAAACVPCLWAVYRTVFPAAGAFSSGYFLRAGLGAGLAGASLYIAAYSSFFASVSMLCAVLSAAIFAAVRRRFLLIPLLFAMLFTVLCLARSILEMGIWNA